MVRRINAEQVQPQDILEEVTLFQLKIELKGITN